jgi:FlaA1/EpsC-like NDP-sugar epimerase
MSKEKKAPVTNRALPVRKTARFFERWHRDETLLILLDLAVVFGAYFLALWFEFDCRYSQIPQKYLMAWLKFSPIYSLVSIVVLWLFHLHQSVWKFASVFELEKIVLASAILGVFHTLFIMLVFEPMPIAYYILGISIQLFLLLFVRFAYRFFHLRKSKREKKWQGVLASRVMLIGAGTAGQMLLRDLHGTGDCNDRVCCIIDDDKNKWGRFIDGVPIVGGRDEILLNVEKYKIEKIFLAIPSATS